MRQFLFLLTAMFLLNSCTFFKNVRSTIFPYYTVDVETLAGTHAPQPTPSTQPAATTHHSTTQAEPNKHTTQSNKTLSNVAAEPTPVSSGSKHTASPKLSIVPREFRAAWIASVANINWPSKPGLSTAEQQAEAISILNYLQNNNFNAVILQVRPQADALYASKIEPWSYFLTGQQNKAPQPFYDPLEFWIREAHTRGMELHAWLNPYRAHHTSGKSISDRSIVRTNPEMVYLLKEGFWWMDPAMQSTQDHTSRVVMDIVKRYDVDGIHFDDYFYPYPSYNGDRDFPDEKSWNDYLKKGGSLSRGDWRRDAVNKLIQRLYHEIKHEKKHVKFGLSPFGIYRPGYPASIQGFDQYEKLYADAKLWLNKGWIDYFTPQLYWPINKPGQSFPVLLQWWQQENTHQRHLWPGISIGTNKNGVTDNKEVLAQIDLSRGMIPKSMGTVHWNVSSLTKNPTLTTALKEGPYQTQALIPASPWLGQRAPSKPKVSLNKNGESIILNWNATDKDIFKWVVYTQYENKWDYQIMGRDQMNTSFKLNTRDQSGKNLLLKNVMVTSVDRNGNESEQVPIAVE